MKNITKFFIALSISILFFGSIVYAATTLYPNRGGTGLTSYTTGDIIYSTGPKVLNKLNIGSNNQFLRSNGSAPVWQTISTSDIPEGTNLYYTLNRWASAQAGTTTDSLAEGIVNFYATQERWDTFWNASTTLDSVTTIPNLSITESQISDLTHYTSQDFASDLAGTTTDALLEGSNNLYWTDTRFDERLSATTTLPNLTTLLGLQNATTSQLTVLDLSWFNGLSVFDSGLISNASSTIPELNTDQIQLQTGLANPAYSEGLIFWDEELKCPAYYNDKMGIIVCMSAPLRATNKTGSDMATGTVVYINGAQGNRPTITLADASTEETSDDVIGFTMGYIADNETSYVALDGMILRGEDTSAFSAGDELSLSTTTPGGYENYIAKSPNHNIHLGHVSKSDGVDGHIVVDIQYGFELFELHDVSGDLRTPTDKQMIFWDNSASVWNQTTGLFWDNDLTKLTTTNLVSTNSTSTNATTTDIHWSGSATGDSSNLSVSTIGSPTYTTLGDNFYLNNSSGQITGGVLSDAGGENIAVSAGTGMIRSTDDHIGALSYMDWIASSTIPAELTTMYVGVDYNGGSPIIVTKATDTWNLHDEFPLGSYLKENGAVHPFNNPQAIANFQSHVLERLYETEPFEYAKRVGGGAIGETGTRNLTLTAAEFYDRNNEFPISSKDTSGADVLTIYYRDGGGGWNFIIDTIWDNDGWDDNGGATTTLTTNRFVAHHIFQDMEDDTGSMILVYGQTQYVSLAGAEDDPEPTGLPARITSHGKYMGKIIFQRNDVTLQSIISTIIGADGGGTAQSIHPNLSTLDWLNAGHVGTALTFAGFDGSGNATEYTEANYLLTDGTRTATGDFDWGGFDLDNIGNSTTTNATTTTMYISQAVNFMGEQFTNFTTYVRSLFTGGNHITITAGSIAVDDDFLLNDGDIGTGVYDFGGADSFELPNGAGGTTVDATGEVTIDSTSQTLNFYGGTAERVNLVRWSKTLNVENATTTDGVLKFRTYVENAITADKVVASYSCEAPCTSGMSFNLEHNTTLDGAGNDLFSADINANSSTTPEVFTTGFGDATIPAGSYIWLVPSSASTTQITNLEITILGYRDP
jgi:hypothetical protein